MAKKKRTTLHSSTGKKLYAVRDEEGKFEDIQTFQRAHSQDMQRTSQAETATKAKVIAAPKKVAKKEPVAKSATPKKAATKKVVSKTSSKKVVPKKAAPKKNAKK